ncbi:hypothetical protein REPUB_Repub10bG0089200 [Reevesia pubescens]
MCEDSSSQPIYTQDDVDLLLPLEVNDDDEENFSIEQMDDQLKQKRKNKANSDKKSSTHGATVKKRMTKEERIRMLEEKKLKKEQEKLQKAALKAEAADIKKLQKERQKWEKGKFVLKSIVAEIDTKVVELGSIGGHLLSRFADKGLTYRITSNPIEKSIIRTMTVPEHISQLSSEGLEIQYILIVYEAAEFCDLDQSISIPKFQKISMFNIKVYLKLIQLSSHARRLSYCVMDLVIRHFPFVLFYPSFSPSRILTILLAKLHHICEGRENELYKNPANDSGWRRPPVEEIHSRQCVDEAELDDHIVGLTCSLASCQFRLKALLTIPKVQPRFALAIWKKYPTLKSLLHVYVDPTKSVHEKEILLKDLVIEGLLGNDRRLGEVCSKRVYRILMAQSGSIKTDDVEDGADFFRH